MWRLNNNIEVFRKNQNEIVVVHRGIGRCYEYNVNNNGERLLHILSQNGGFIPDDQNEAELQQPIAGLSQEGILTEEMLPETQHSLRSQLQAFREWGLKAEEAQEKIESAKIALIGVGGTGSWLAIQMASLGIKNLALIDPDRVELSNLVRQHYTRSDVGAYKVTALKRHLLARCPEMKIKTIKSMVDVTSPFKSWFNDYDYILVAGDNPSLDELASLVGRWCCQNGKKHIICGGYSGHNGALGLSVIPGETPCWECYRHWCRGRVPSAVRDENLICSGPRNSAAMVPLVMLAASISAYELLRHLVGLKPLLVGGRFDYSPDKMSFDKTHFSAQQECEHCHNIGHN